MVKKYCQGCKIAVNPGGFFGMGCNCIEFEDGAYCDICAEEMVKKRRSKLGKPKQQRRETEEVEEIEEEPRPRRKLKLRERRY